MTLATNTAGTNASDLVQSQIDTQGALSNAAIASALAQVYFDYSTTGTLGGADLSVGGTKSLLDPGFLSETSPATLAAAICDYWATNITPGDPVVGDSVVSVVINSSAKVGEMTTAITALKDATPTSLEGAWQRFYAETELIVNSFECIVTELVATVPTPFVRAIS